MLRWPCLKDRRGLMWTNGGHIEVTDPADLTVKEGNNLCLIEYELVTVVEE
ncbi:hypothetical protein BHE74_00059725 [Ensete ventricosum]|nr:hypothetical protein BHE74_00059725 [Ensete ventricosum]RZS29218.1 hypothetical protein BHM03_00062928 [Ensete ventricosum]